MPNLGDDADLWRPPKYEGEQGEDEDLPTIEDVTEATCFSPDHEVFFVRPVKSWSWTAEEMFTAICVAKSQAWSESSLSPAREERAQRLNASEPPSLEKAVPKKRARNKCHASSNKCLTSSNKKLLETSFLLLLVRHLLLEAMHLFLVASLLPQEEACSW